MDKRVIKPLKRRHVAFFIRAAAFLTGLVLICVALAPLDTHSDVGTVGEKYEYFSRHAGEFDTIFIGSSYFYRQISPSLFDSEVQARGLDSRSFNFGIPGMDPPESYYLLDQILAEEPGGLRYVYLELDYFQTRAKDATVGTRRFEYWHSPGYTAAVLSALADSDLTWGWKAKQGPLHVDAMLRRTFHLGQGRALLGGLFGRVTDEEAEGMDVLGPARDGWLSTDDEESNRMALRREYMTNVGELPAKVDALRKGHSSSDSEGEAGAKALEEVIARVRAAGATPVLLVPPCLDSRKALIALVGTRLDVDVLVFNDPDRYPEMYESANRFDIGHLNKRGSEIFTRELAARAAELRDQNAIELKVGVLEK